MKQLQEEQVKAYIAGGIQLLLCFFAVAAGIGKWSRQKNKQREKLLAYEGRLKKKEQKAAYRHQMKKKRIQWKKELQAERQEV